MDAGSLLFYAAIFFCGLYFWSVLVSKYWLNLPPSPWPLPLIGHMHLLLGGLPHHRLQTLSKVYGPVLFLRLGATPFVVVTNRELAREVLKTHDHDFASRPYTLVGDYFGYGLRGMAMAPFGEHWKDMRKLCNTELFTARRLDSFLPLRIEELKNLMVALGGSQTRPVNMRELLTAYTFNVTTQILFSKRYYSFNSGVVDVAAGENFVTLSKQIVQEALQFHLSDFVPSYLRWADWTAPGFWRLHLEQDKFLDKLINEHKDAIPSTQRLEDFMDVILKHTKNDPDGEDKTKAVTTELLMAGADTSSTIIEWALAELLNSPHVLRAAQEEIDTVVGSNRMVDESDFVHLVYSGAMVKEVFRLHPPVSLLLPRATIENCKLAGYNIPKGAVTLINAYAIGRDPLLWENPEEFNPERFIGKELDVKGKDYELLPFGSGRRACPGMMLGLKTVQLVLFNLLHSFDWSTVPGKKYELEEVYGTVAWLKTPLEAFATPRLSPTITVSHNIACS